MRRPRAFWQARVGEVASGRQIERVAAQHGVAVARLRWWRWRLATDAAVDAPRLVEVVLDSASQALQRAILRLLIDGVTLELPADTAPEFVARLLQSLRATC